MRGDRAVSHDGTEVVLVDVGTDVLLDTDEVRVWQVALRAGGHHPWHQHHNPYVVFSIAGSTGRMDWLDGRPSRHIEEYPGGVVFRPVSPIHCLTNTSQGPYRSRLIELKSLGESRADGPWDVGVGARSEPREAELLGDGRTLVLETEHVSVWRVTLPGSTSRVLDLRDVSHVLARVVVDGEPEELLNSVSEHPGGPVTIENDGPDDASWFVLSLDYLTKMEQYR